MNPRRETLVCSCSACAARIEAQHEPAPARDDRDEVVELRRTPERVASTSWSPEVTS